MRPPGLQARTGRRHTGVDVLIARPLATVGPLLLAACGQPAPTDSPSPKIYSAAAFYETTTYRLPGRCPDRGNGTPHRPLSWFPDDDRLLYAADPSHAP